MTQPDPSSFWSALWRTILVVMALHLGAGLANHAAEEWLGRGIPMDWINIAIGASVIFIFFGIRQRRVASQSVAQVPPSGSEPDSD